MSETQTGSNYTGSTYKIFEANVRKTKAGEKISAHKWEKARNWRDKRLSVKVPFQPPGTPLHRVWNRGPSSRRNVKGNQDTHEMIHVSLGFGCWQRDKHPDSTSDVICVFYIAKVPSLVPADSLLRLCYVERQPYAIWTHKYLWAIFVQTGSRANFWGRMNSSCCPHSSYYHTYLKHDKHFP